MRTVLVVLLLVATCGAPARQWPPPQLPPTPPLRIAFAPPIVHVTGARQIPEVRRDLAVWLNGWHGVTTASLRALDDLPAFGKQLDGYREARGTLLAVCEAARAAGLDAIVFTEFLAFDANGVACADHEFPSGKCVAYRASAQTHPTSALAFRALYPAHCILAATFDASSQPPFTEKLLTWPEHQGLIASALPDYLRRFDTEWKVSETLLLPCPVADVAACTAPISPR